ncbi:MAG: G5 domain-containing protein [Ruminiclostridium sp.]|nr:G5 domain-containing protein [Ruminiclostridium sp.]
MLKLRNNSGAVTGTAAVAISAVSVVTAVTALCAAKITAPRYPAVIVEDGIEYSIETRVNNIDDFVTEQRAKLHPYDVITYAGSNEDGELEIAVERAPHVTLSFDGTEERVRAISGETVADLLARENVTVGEYDFLSPSADSRINANCTVSVTRAFPVMITIGITEKEVLAAGITAGELLVREGISLSGYDELNCPVDEVVHEGMTIEIKRIEYRKHTESENIPFETEYTDSPLLKIGDSEIVSEGVEGVVTRTITDKFINGEPVSSEVTDTVVTEPVNRVVANGTALNTPYSRREGDYTLEDGVPTEYEYVLEGKVTAYYAPEGAGTFSGRPLMLGSVGVDPDVIPFGSELYITSMDGSHVYGYAVASDTGYIKGTGIICDAYMGPTFEDAFQWQAQYCNVYVLKTGDNSVSWR